jgi:hypothetical protein
MRGRTFHFLPERHKSLLKKRNSNDRQTETHQHHFTPLRLKHGRTLHGELIMHSTDVVEGPWRRESHPKARDSGIGLGEVRAILGKHRRCSRCRHNVYES